ncbi:hypothetical protein [Streptomyces sp. ME19-01-6]|uniref:hypothetical protein n=1 Tax=Streptomyces sp. ME19-01-6 TaxID=3028686 RepID=UPI0029A72704|nr:hypothetical protein [Streptomyces sp. ME19-01-6]MDX3228140.1 hypothetical protein [Streptomyces sp. ME19-01-6]
MRTVLALTVSAGKPLSMPLIQDTGPERELLLFRTGQCFLAQGDSELFQYGH